VLDFRKGKIMDNKIVVEGFVVIKPELMDVTGRDPFVAVRLASTPRYFDDEQMGLLDLTTNWFDVRFYGENAGDVYEKVDRGTRVIIGGSIRSEEIRSFDVDSQNIAKSVVQYIEPDFAICGFKHEEELPFGIINVNKGYKYVYVVLTEDSIHLFSNIFDAVGVAGGNDYTIEQNVEYLNINGKLVTQDFEVTRIEVM
jgi:single-stranded DNA-binding protein